MVYLGPRMTLRADFWTLSNWFLHFCVRLLCQTTADCSNLLLTCKTYKSYVSQLWKVFYIYILHVRNQIQIPRLVLSKVWIFLCFPFRRLTGLFCLCWFLSNYSAVMCVCPINGFLFEELKPASSFNFNVSKELFSFFHRVANFMIRLNNLNSYFVAKLILLRL